MGQKTEPYFEDWNAAELFDYLQTNHVISEDEDYENWMYDRTDMIQMARDYYETK